MKTYKIIFAICLGITLSGATSCKLSKEELRTITRKTAGKDDFRDSEKWGKVVTKTLDLSEFTHIILAGNADIKFRQGDSQSIEAYGNEKAIEGNDIRVENGTLIVTKKPDADKRLPSIKLIVTAPALKSIQVSGAGDIEMKDAVKLDNDLSIHISGAGDIDIKQLSCKNFDINISGAGDISAQKIKCKTATVNISGAGDMKADIKADDISVLISGAGDADLDVKCQNLNVSASGTGEIELEGECAHLIKQSGGMASIDSRKLTIRENINIQ